MTHVGPLSPNLVDFPPLRKALSSGHVHVLLLRTSSSMSIGNKNATPGPCVAAVSDSVLITNKVYSNHKGVQLANSHIRFKDDFECSDFKRLYRRLCE